MVSRWFPLYLLGIAALTLFPFSPAACPRPGWVIHLGRFDFVANLLAFLPIGLALRRSALSRTLALAFALSLAIEVCQQWLPRQQDVTDLVSNTLGAGLGWWLARRWSARWPGPLLRPVTRRLLLRAAAVLVTGAVAWQAASSPRHDFSNWLPFPLVVGNSPYGDRPWMGELSELALYDRVLRADEQPGRLAEDGGPVLWAEGGPILWLGFAENEASGRVDGPAGPVRLEPRVGQSTFLSASGLTLRPSGLAVDPWVAEHVVERLRERGVLSLDVRLRAGVLRQHGPAHIVSLGSGGPALNLLLAQRSAGFIARIRTPASGPRGARGELETHDLRVTMKPQQLRLIYDGAEARLWVDGVCEDDGPIAIGSSPRMVGPLLGVSIVSCTLLAGLAAASFAHRRGLRIALAAAGALLAWSLLHALGAWSHLPDFDTSARLLGLAAAAAMLPVLLRPR